MDKYSGCNVVESVVKSEKKGAVKVKKKHGSALLIRLAVAAALVGVICFVAYAPLSFLSVVRDALKSVFCYDVFGRDGFGVSSVFTRLFGGA